MLRIRITIIENNEVKDIEIPLPPEKSLEERITYANEIIEKYPEFFKYVDTQFIPKYGSKIDCNQGMKSRLSILGTYILMADPNYNEDTLTYYRIKKTPKREIPFTDIKNAEELGLC
jgi:hypothetical protein